MDVEELEWNICLKCKEFGTTTSLVVQLLRLSFQCRGRRFDGNFDPICHMAKKKIPGRGKDYVEYRGHEGHGSFGEPLVIQLRWSSK